MKRLLISVAWTSIGLVLLTLALTAGSASADPPCPPGTALISDPARNSGTPFCHWLSQAEYNRIWYPPTAVPAPPSLSPPSSGTSRDTGQDSPRPPSPADEPRSPCGAGGIGWITGECDGADGTAPQQQPQPAQQPAQQQQTRPAPPAAQPQQTRPPAQPPQEQPTAQQPGTNPTDDRALLLALWGPIRGGDIPSQLVSPQETTQGEEAMVRASAEFQRLVGKDNQMGPYVGALIGRAAYYASLRGSDGKPLFPSLASGGMTKVITSLGVMATGGDLNALVALTRLIDMLARQDAALLPAAGRQ